MGGGSYVDGEAQRKICIQRDKTYKAISNKGLSVTMARYTGKEGLLLFLHRVDVFEQVLSLNVLPTPSDSQYIISSRSNVFRRKNTGFSNRSISLSSGRTETRGLCPMPLVKVSLSAKVVATDAVILSHRLDISREVVLDDRKGHDDLSHGHDELRRPEKHEEEVPPPLLHLVRVFETPHRQVCHLLGGDLGKQIATKVFGRTKYKSLFV